MIWDWLCGLSASDIRDIVLSIAAPFAVWLAWRRLRNADRQEENTRLGQLSDRFTTNVELLGHAMAAVRQGAICVLAELALLYPERYHVTVMRIFVSYLAYPPEDRRAGKFVLDGPDIAEIERMFRQRFEIQHSMEQQLGFDLHESLRSTLFSFGRQSTGDKRGLVVDEEKRLELEQERFQQESC